MYNSSNSFKNRTSTNHFNRFLRVAKNPENWTTVNDLPGDCNVLCTYLGHFSDYLKTRVETITKWKAHSNYLMPIKEIMLEKLIDVTAGVRNKFENHYKNLRKITKSIYTAEYNKRSENMIKSKVVFTLKQFDYMCWKLFERGDYGMLVIEVS